MTVEMSLNAGKKIHQNTWVKKSFVPEIYLRVKLQQLYHLPSRVLADPTAGNKAVCK